MHNQEISRQIQRLQDLIKRTADASGSSIELQAHWARYICILSAGLVENALKEIYTDYARRTVSRPVANYVISHISQIRNPKTDRFIEIAAAFNEDWKNELENYANTNGRDDAATSIMLHRHRIAHGQSHTSSISMAQIKEYLAKAIEVLEFVEDQCRR